ncbi:hypothetical protein A4H97_08230 [Niastella yeongjuensis]|uniref:Uncharacterized protein n=1 Tax=Niastella yeongjuensis TaxID=354355 RepID=A0A1V9EMV4_9BACT|nr:hypothetical protein [Niastella yeongjuensis]OQP47469.1 hypothetical protein A4H97_08230 [Niastella yeongjuensis]SEN85767.1 hypothetical protein SAMN05660816_01673 [Niastella yeongjuensis]
MNVLNHTPDTALLLAKLADIIGQNHEPVDRYLQQHGEHEIFNPLRETGETVAQPMVSYFPSTFWEMLGIRHIISNIHRSKTASQGQWTITTDADPYKWGHMRKDTSIEELTKYLGDCCVIQFADYVSVKDAAGFWDGLFADVIKKGVDKRTIEYVFQLGDVTGHTVFEVDEVLDIIGQYNKHGRVSLVQDEQESDKLWDLLCGINYEPSAKEKYMLQFSTMRIDSLLILYNNGVMLFSKEGHSDFPGGPVNNNQTSPHNREFFLAGYRLGLLLHLTIPHAIVLGLAVSGACRANASIPTSRSLLTYINDWASTISNI